MPRGKQKESPVKLTERLVKTVPHGLMGQALIVSAMADAANRLAASDENGSGFISGTVQKEVGEFLQRELTAWHNS